MEFGLVRSWELLHLSTAKLLWNLRLGNVSTRPWRMGWSNMTESGQCSQKLTLVRETILHCIIGLDGHGGTDLLWSISDCPLIPIEDPRGMIKPLSLPFGSELSGVGTRT